MRNNPFIELKQYKKYKLRDKRKVLFCQVCGADIRWKKSNRVICLKLDCYKIYRKRKKAKWFQENKKKIYQTMYKWRRLKRLEKQKQKDKEFIDNLIGQANKRKKKN